MNRSVSFVILYLLISAIGLSAQTSDCLILGGNSTNQYVAVPPYQSINNLTSNYTLEAWIYPTGFNYLGGIISKYTFNYANRSYVLRLSENGSGGNWGLNFDGMNTANNILSLNQWYHIAAVNNNGTRTLYVNGNLVPLSGSPIDPQVGNSSNLYIGRDWNEDNQRCFQGRIDEVRIWNIPLSATTINQQRFNRLTGSEAGLVLYWDFTYMFYAYIGDLTGNNHGTLRNGAYIADLGVWTLVGNGTTSSRYQISEKKDLLFLSNNIALMNSHFSQTADISFAQSDFSQNDWTPIGFILPFTGTYLGNGHKISGIYPSDSFAVPEFNIGGLFAQIYNATISDLTLENTYFYAINICGGLTGIAYDNSTITNCHIINSISETTGTSGEYNCATGGLVGIATGFSNVSAPNVNITDCSFQGTVIGYIRVGGLAGMIHESTDILRCSSAGYVHLSEVNGSRYIGGLIGVVEDKGFVLGTPNNIVIQRSFSTAGVNGRYSLGDVGGLIGFINNSHTIIDCYSTGNVSGPITGGDVNRGIGGLIGKASSTSNIYRVYSSGQVSKGSSSLVQIGGLIGIGDCPTNNSFWDNEASTQTSSAGSATGLTTNEMKTFTSLYNAGWDFVLETTNGENSIWNTDGVNNSGYPYLNWQVPAVAVTPVISFADDYLYAELDAQSELMAMFSLVNSGNGGSIISLLSTATDPAPISVFYENFEGAFPPAGWTTPNQGQNTWHRTNLYDDHSLNDTYFACAFRLNQGTVSSDLITPPIDLSGSHFATLEFDHSFYATGNSTISVEVWNGTNWTEVMVRGENFGTWGYNWGNEIDTPSPEHTTIDVTDFINSEFKVKFVFGPGAESFWGVDNINISSKRYPFMNFANADQIYRFMPHEPEKTFTVDIESHTLPDGETNSSLNLVYSGGSETLPVIIYVNANYETAVNPAAINFGAVLAGSTQTQTFTLANNGDFDINYTITTPPGFTISEAGGRSEFRNELPISLTSGMEVTCNVDFSPTENINYSGNITISSNDLENPLILLPVSGSGYSTPILNYSPHSYSATYSLNTQQAFQITLENTGNAELEYDIEAYAIGEETILYSENFETGLPADWTTTTNSAQGWFITTGEYTSGWWSIPNRDGNYACSNDDLANDDGSVDYLISPAMDLSYDTAINLRFLSCFTGACDQTAHIVVTENNGTSWTPLFDLQPATDWTTVTVPLNDFCGPGHTNVKIGFHSNDNGDWGTGWAVDDVEITGYEHIFGDWITIGGESSVSGTTDVNVTSQLLVNMDFSSISVGVHNAEIAIYSNDLATPFAFIPVTAEVLSISAPQNVAISYIGGNVNISWDAVSGANSYKVFGSSSSDSGFTEIASGLSGLNWSMPYDGILKFFYVVASTDTPGRVTHKMSEKKVNKQ